MICPNCKKEYKGSHCPVCGAEPEIFRKTAGISKKLYNKGLTEAQRGNLSGAIELLVRSVTFNKRNTDARNLLGLCYFALGRVGESLREWVISVSYKKEGNPADGYLRQFQNNPRKMEQYSDSIRMYNQSLHYLRQKSEDMAIIQLKKALELNAGYVDALNMLALCYLLQKDKAKAAAAVEKALAIDAYNPVALHYYRELNPGKTMPEARNVRKQEPAPVVKQEPRVAYAPSYAKESRAFSGGFMAMAALFVIGAVCALAVMYVLFIPAAIGSKDDEIKQLMDKLSAAETQYQNDVSQRDATITRLDGEIVDYREKNQEMAEKIEDYEKKLNLYAALSLLQQDKMEEAVAALSKMDPTGLPPDLAETYAYIENTAYPALEAQYVGKATKEYNARNYNDAKTSFETAVLYAREDSTSVDDCYYFLGRIGEINGDKDTAKNCYNKIIDNFPDSNRLNQAKTRLRGLN